MAGRALKPRTPYLQGGHPLNSGLAGAWLLTEGGGTRAHDVSGRVNHATLQSPTFFISTGRTGPALDGGGLAVVAYTDKNYGSGSIFLNMTLSAWFNVPAATSGSQAPIIGLSDSQTGDSATYDHLLYLDASGHVGGYIYDGAVKTAVSTETFFDANWHHAVVTIRNGVEMVVWVDGVKRATTAIGSPYSGYSTAYLVIGKTNTTQFSHVGKYDDFRVWPYVRQGREIIALYNTDYSEFRTPRQILSFTVPAGGGVTGTGALAAQSASLAGAGLSSSTGTGVLSAQSSTLSGVGASASIGTGVLTVQTAAIAGAGLSSSVGIGALAAQQASALGGGLSSSTGTGTLIAGSSSIIGTQGLAAIGVLAAQAATILGVGVIGNVFGAVRLAVPHSYSERVYPADTVFRPGTHPPDFHYTPLMIPLDRRALEDMTVIIEIIYGPYANPLSIDTYTRQRLIWEPRPIPPVNPFGPPGS